MTFDVSMYLQNISGTRTEAGGKVVCMLCNTVGIDSSSWASHTRERDHQSRYAEVKRFFHEKQNLEARHMFVMSVKPRISALGSPAWRNDVNTLALSFLTENDPFVKAEVSKKLKGYEHLERISLLGQAVWKSVCIMNPKNPCNDYFFWSRWTKEQWKEQKKAYRCSNEINIVMTLVMPFVGKKSS